MLRMKSLSASGVRAFWTQRGNDVAHSHFRSKNCVRSVIISIKKSGSRQMSNSSLLPAHGRSTASTRFSMIRLTRYERAFIATTSKELQQKSEIGKDGKIFAYPSLKTIREQ